VLPEGEHSSCVGCDTDHWQDEVGGPRDAGNRSGPFTCAALETLRIEELAHAGRVITLRRSVRDRRFCWVVAFIPFMCSYLMNDEGAQHPERFA